MTGVATGDRVVFNGRLLLAPFEEVRSYDCV
jgi:hypothetical protein